MSTGMVTQARACYPDAKLYWLCETQNKALIEAHPAITGVLVFNKKRWLRALSTGRLMEVRALYRELLNACPVDGFDVIVDLQGLMKSGLLSRLLPARRRVGFHSKEGVNWCYHERVPKILNEDLSSEYRAMCQYLFQSTSHFQIGIPVSETLRTQVAARLGILGAPLVVCAPFTTRPQKHWFLDHWKALIHRLVNITHVQVLILGGPGDVGAASELCQDMPECVVNATGKTTLVESNALISLATQFIGVDTGLSHMAVSHQVPATLIFGSTRPYLNTFSAPTKILYEPLDCAPCKRRPTCNGAYHCMQAITPERVIASLTPALSQQPLL